MRQCKAAGLPLMVHPHDQALMDVIERDYWERQQRDALAYAKAYAAYGETLIHEGQADGPLYTLLQGWAFRFKTLSDGRRQILNFLLAGDFIGVQQKMGDAAPHGPVLAADGGIAIVCGPADDAGIVALLSRRD